MSAPTARPQSVSPPKTAGERDKRALVSLLTAADRIRRYFGRILEPHGLTVQQYNVLRILRGASPEALPTLEIGARMIEKTPGVSRLLDRLAAHGLVERQRCPEDRRQVLCRLTDEAWELLARLDEPIALADRACLSNLSAAEKAQLLALTARISP